MLTHLPPRGAFYFYFFSLATRTSTWEFQHSVPKGILPFVRTGRSEIQTEPCLSSFLVERCLDTLPRTEARGDTSEGNKQGQRRGDIRVNLARFQTDPRGRRRVWPPFSKRDRAGMSNSGVAAVLPPASPKQAQNPPEVRKPPAPFQGPSRVLPPLTTRTEPRTTSETLCRNSAAVPGLLSARVNFRVSEEEEEDAAAD